jgi:hypothetical protein
VHGRVRPQQCDGTAHEDDGQKSRHYRSPCILMRNDINEERDASDRNDATRVHEPATSGQAAKLARSFEVEDRSQNEHRVGNHHADPIWRPGPEIQQKE